MTTHTITPQPYRDLFGVFTATLTPARCPVGVYAVRLERGARMPPERHANAERIIAYGPLCVTVDGHTHALDAGQCVDVPAGAEHEVANPTARTVEYIAIATPAFGEATPVTVPASVAERMGKLASGGHEVEELLSWALDDAGEAERANVGQDDSATVEALTNGAATMLHALALLTADEPAGGVP